MDACFPGSEPYKVNVHLKLCLNMNNLGTIPKVFLIRPDPIMMSCPPLFTHSFTRLTSVHLVFYDFFTRNINKSIGRQSFCLEMHRLLGPYRECGLREWDVCCSVGRSGGSGVLTTRRGGVRGRQTSSQCSAHSTSER